MDLISVRHTRVGNLFPKKSYLLYFILTNMVSKIEEKLADKAEPILGFRPSSKVKRGQIGIIISIICIVIVIIELIRSGVI